MALDAEQLELLDFAVKALPSWFTDDARALEELAGAAATMGDARAVVAYWFAQTLIRGATGKTFTTPDWLNQHAVDRGTRRQANESDPALRDRLRNVPDALTRAALLSATNAILAAEGISGQAAMVELPRDAGHWGSYTSDSGVGGTFVKDGTTIKFTPSGAWAVSPFRAASVVPVVRHNLVLSGAASGGNDGTFEIAGLEGNAALVTNGSGVAGVDATVAWTVQKLDVNGNVTDGFGRFYWGRGYRWSRTRPTIVIILPFGATDGTASSVREMLRQKKAAGRRAIVEVRAVP